MQYTINCGEKGKVEIKVDVAKSEFEATYYQILSKLGQETKIAGFRPGKVPFAVVEGKVGVNKILNETASSLISKHLSAILDKEKLIPLDSPKIAISSLAKNSALSFSVSFTQRPKVHLGEWKKIKVKKVEAREITEKDVEESIKNIYVAWVKNKSKVKSQKSKVEGEGEPETRDQKPGTKFIYDAHGNKIFIKDEESKSKVENGSPSTNDQDEIDDNFAKAIGARDLSHLRELVRHDLETIVADQVEVKLESEIFDELISISELEVPDILIDEELNRILVRLTAELERQGKKLEDYLSEQSTTLDALKAKWRPQAEKNVKATLILEAIGKEEKVQVADAEVEQALKSVTQSNLDENQKQNLKSYIATSIFQAKTLDLVKKTVTE